MSEPDFFNSSYLQLSGEIPDTSEIDWFQGSWLVPGLQSVAGVDVALIKTSWLDCKMLEDHWCRNDKIWIVNKWHHRLYPIQSYIYIYLYIYISINSRIDNYWCTIASRAYNGHWCMEKIGKIPTWQHCSW